MKILWGSILLSLFVSCGGGSQQGARFTGGVEADDSIGAISFRSPDYASAKISLVNSYGEISPEFYRSTSDISIQCFGSELYLLEKLQRDSLTKFKLGGVLSLAWQRSLRVSGFKSNPVQVIPIHQEKAYVIFYGLNQVWVINPKADKEEDFKMAEIDLTFLAENDRDGIAEIHMGTIHQGKLYLNVQNLEFWQADKKSSLAVIDVETDQFVEQIPLQLRNPVAKPIIYQNKVYMAAAGNYFCDGKLCRANPFSGLEIYDLESKTSQVLLRGQRLVDIEIANDRIYYVVYESREQGGEILSAGQWRSSPLAGYPEYIHSDIDQSDIGQIEFDRNGRLWVLDQSQQAPKVMVYDPLMGQIQSTIETSLIPMQVAFCE